MATLAVILGQALAFPFTGTEGGRIGSVQTTLSLDDDRSCWLDSGTWILWPEGTDTASLQLAYNNQAAEFAAVSARHLIEVDHETGEIIREEHGLAGARLSPAGQLLSGPTTIISATISTCLTIATARPPMATCWSGFHHRAVRKNRRTGCDTFWPKTVL